MVRHPVVARIVRAYEVHDAEQERIRKARKEEALRLQQEQATNAVQHAENDAKGSDAK